MIGREAGVHHPDRFEDPRPQELPQGLTGGTRDEHTEHVRAGVVEPALPRLVQQRERRQPAHPFVGRGRQLWFRRTAAQGELTHRVEQRLRPGRLEVHPEPEPEREDVVNCDLTVRRNRVSFEGSTPVDEHAAIGELGKQRVDGIRQTQRGLLHEEQRPERDDRFRHRGNAKDAVSTNRIGISPGEVPGRADLDVIAAGGKPRHPAGPVLFHMAGHHVMKTRETTGIESAHRSSTLRRPQSHRWATVARLTRRAGSSRSPTQAVAHVHPRPGACFR